MQWREVAARPRSGVKFPGHLRQQIEPRARIDDLGRAPRARDQLVMLGGCPLVFFLMPFLAAVAFQAAAIDDHRAARWHSLGQQSRATTKLSALMPRCRFVQQHPT
jgi:hypothetical protein